MELLIETLQQHKNPVYAKQMSDYMRNLFPFLGIANPQRKALTKQFIKQTKNWEIADMMKAVDVLFLQNDREFQYVAIDMIEANYKRINYEEFQQLLVLIDRKAWWESVDTLRKSIGLWVKIHREHMDEIMETLLQADSFWQRRVAITMQLGWKKETNTEWLAEAIVRNKEDREFFIQKAIGWALREYSKVDRDWVELFIQEHDLSSLAVREGGKYL